MKKTKLKDLLSEHAWDHEFGQPLATITDVTAAHANKTLQERKYPWSADAEKLHNGIVKMATKIWGKDALENEYSGRNGTSKLEVYADDGHGSDVLYEITIEIHDQ
jgi:hypothetical protein